MKIFVFWGTFQNEADAFNSADKEFLLKPFIQKTYRLLDGGGFGIIKLTYDNVNGTPLLADSCFFWK